MSSCKHRYIHGKDIDGCFYQCAKCFKYFTCSVKDLNHDVVCFREDIVHEDVK